MDGNQHYIAMAKDLGVHRFRPVAVSNIVSNCVISRVLSRDTKWKTVGEGYTFATWDNLGRWLMIVYANTDYERLRKQNKSFTPIVVVVVSLQSRWMSSVRGVFMPSRNISRIGIVYPSADILNGYTTGPQSILREFDMYSGI